MKPTILIPHFGYIICVHMTYNQFLFLQIFIEFCSGGAVDDIIVGESSLSVA